MTISCRFCQAPLTDRVIDLGTSPLCERLVSTHQLNEPEQSYAYQVWICRACKLVQVQHEVPVEKIFGGDYAYLSSYSNRVLADAEHYVRMMQERLGLSESSFVVEVGSNDGYLLQYLVRARIPCMGVDPVAHIAERAREKGVTTLTTFFDADAARAIRQTQGSPDLIIANVVLATTPNPGSFIEGIALLLKSTGTATLEFPHVMRLIQRAQFDTMYHEHFSHFSLTVLERILRSHRLVAFDVEELDVQGGSLRVYVRHEADSSRPVTDRVREMLKREDEAGVDRVETYLRFEDRAKEVKNRLLDLMASVRRKGELVVGYGAPGKATTLLSYCGIGREHIPFTVDRNPYKHGKYLPGSRIPIYPPARIDAVRPRFILILPWNLKEEIIEQLAYTREWDARFVVPIPEPSIIH